MKPLDIKISPLAFHRVKILHATLFHLILATTTSLAGGQTGSGSGMMESSSLFVASQDISTDGWEQYKTESLPSEDLNQCLARCMLHQKQWWDGLHSGWVRKLPKISNYMSRTSIMNPFSKGAMQSSLNRSYARRRTSHNSRY